MCFIFLFRCLFNNFSLGLYWLGFMVVLDLLIVFIVFVWLIFFVGVVWMFVWDVGILIFWILLIIKTFKFFYVYKYNDLFVCINFLVNIGNKNDLFNCVWWVLRGWCVFFLW